MTRVNSPNSWLGSLDWDKFIENRPKQIRKLNSRLIKCWMVKLKKNQFNKKKTKSTRLTFQTFDLGHEAWITS
jgi:hypothetical protein